MIGYWKLRGFFHAYVKGRKIGSFPTPEEAQAAINKEVA